MTHNRYVKKPHIFSTYASSMMRWTGVESKLDDAVALQRSGNTTNSESPDSTWKPKYIL